jgi:RNA polymerase sigma-54 factor
MKTSLQLKVSQHLTMTPQLQQAIRLLQLSTLELKDEIQEALDNNPLLEVAEDTELESATEAEAEPTSDYDRQVTLSEPPDHAELETPDWEHTDNDEEWQVHDSSMQLNEDSWQGSGDGAGQDFNAGEGFNFDQQSAQGDELRQHLMWQLNLTPMSERDRVIATAIIDSVAPSGWLSSPIAEIFEGLQAELDEPDDPLDMAEVMAVLHRLQQFEPTGVCAQDLAECLSIQLKQLPEDTPLLGAALRLVNEFSDALVHKNYTLLMRRLQLQEAQLRDAMALIQSTNPYPGARIDTSRAEYIIPDVIVSRDPHNKLWRVDLNPDISPRLRVNQGYAALIRRADPSADNQFLKDHLQEARWFIKSLHSRNDTLLRVAREIVARQLAFLELGEQAMKPMILHDIAEVLELHESTISRVTTHKYMHTPRGVFELKYFFSSHVSTEDGGEYSSTAIRAQIKELIQGENRRKPLSDSKIVTLLNDQGIQVARRTIAKYRESLNIPPSNERKTL